MTQRIGSRLLLPGKKLGDSADGKLEKYIGEEDAISLGLRIDTYGHKFLFLLSNSDDIGIRRTSLGVQKDTFWRFGFNIQRRFDW